LASRAEGLNENEVDERLKSYGRNKLKKTRQFDWVKVLFDQFKSYLILVLVFAAVLSFFMESKVDAIVILIIIVLNAGLGFFQEFKAEKAIEDLKKMMTPYSKVLRNGRIKEINSERIVPGDILILSEGDKVMADARVLVSEGLNVNESSLTGESVPEFKIIDKLKKGVPLAERNNMIYQGTEVVSGSGKAIVVETGMTTELGKISELVQTVKAERNPFRDKLDVFAKQIGIFILILSILVIGLLIFEGVEVIDSFLVAISLAVSAIPEGLPAIVSLGLAFATRRMIRKNVLIRKLPASETLGRTTVICTDKTGTLTEEEMNVISLYTNGKFNFGTGLKGKELLLRTGVLCNEAKIEVDEKGREYSIGDPTEVALIVSAKNNFLDKNKLVKKEPRVKTFAFTSERKMMSVVRESEEGLRSYVKGAPEKIIERCDYELRDGRKLKLEAKDKERLTKVYEKMAGEGLRVLGFAFKNLKGSLPEGNEDFNITENNLVFVGFQGMIDPPRKEVKNAIKLSQEAGIKVIMITGDSKLTADAVAKQIGLKGESMSAKEMSSMGDRELYNRIKDISVFSRISPEDKLRIINILKQRNEIVAMTGDGVNDALALKRADIGIAMGKRGTDVARSSSDIILLDDNFASIVEGVSEGRRIYDNVKKFVKLLLSANFSEVFLVLTVMLIWRNPELLPLLPIQILWINLVTDSLPALALSNEKAESDVMKRKPSKKGILNGIIGFILLAGFLTFIVDFLFFYGYMADIDKARTMAVTASITFEMFLAFNCKSNKPLFKTKSFLDNKYLIYAVLVSIGLHLLVMYSPLSSLFYFVALGLFDWLMIIGVSLIGFFIIEGYKVWKVKKRKKGERIISKKR